MLLLFRKFIIIIIYMWVLKERVGHGTRFVSKQSKSTAYYAFEWMIELILMHPCL